MSNLNSVFPLERLDEIQKHPEDFRLLERIPLTVDGINTKLPIKLNEPQEGERVHHVVFLDTETTGMDCNQEKIIELGMVRATYSFDRKIMLSIDKIYDEFEVDEINQDDNGDFIISATMPIDKWLIGYLLSFGSKVCIVEPKDLKKIVYKEAKKICKQNKP